jgi:Sec-independent protein translocase protein TatA
VFNLGMGEITVILLLALIFLGPKKLPDLAAGLGKIIKEIRKATSDVKNEIALDDSFRKPFEDLRDAVTLHPDELKRRDVLQKAIAEAQQRDEEAAKAAAESGETQGAPDGLDSPVKTLGVSHPSTELPGPHGHDDANRHVEAHGHIGVGSEPLTNDTIVQSAPPRGATLADIPTPQPVVKPAALPTTTKAPGPPSGSVARPKPAPLFPPAASAPQPHVAAARAPAPNGDTSGITQILKEEDLLPGPTGGGPPPPPHLPGLVRPPTPPPGLAKIDNKIDKKKP